MKKRGMNNKKEIYTIIAGFGIVLAVSLGVSTVVSHNEAEVIPEYPNNIVAENFEQEVQAVDSNKNAPPKTDDVVKAEVLKEEQQKIEDDVEPDQTGQTEETDQEEDTDDETSLIDEFDEVSLMENEIALMWPLKGEIALDFSADAMIFDPTLEQFRTNDSVCILAKEGTDVVAACDGMIESVNADHEKGLVVVISHADGWSTTYSQINSDVAVSVGDKVKKGQVIGQVAMPTKYGAALGPHLEFKLCQGDFAIDPKVAIAQ